MYTPLRPREDGVKETSGKRGDRGGGVNTYLRAEEF